jgi:dipeptidyl aminopeptidase/acylaminoacyl peptidase
MHGEPYLERSATRTLSPLQHMHRARTPTLFLQGMDDQRCPLGQSEELYATLMLSGDVATEMILYPGENHHLVEEGTPSYRIDYISRLVEWLNRWTNSSKHDGDQKPWETETQQS